MNVSRAVRLQRKRAPDAADGRRAEPAARRHRARAPVRRVARRRFQRVADDGFSTCASVIRRGVARPRLIEQALEPAGDEPRAPFAHHLLRDTEPGRDAPYWLRPSHTRARCAPAARAPAPSSAAAPTARASRAPSPSPPARLRSPRAIRHLLIAETRAGDHLFDELRAQDLGEPHDLRNSARLAALGRQGAAPAAGNTLVPAGRSPWGSGHIPTAPPLPPARSAARRTSRLRPGPGQKGTHPLTPFGHRFPGRDLPSTLANRTYSLPANILLTASALSG